MVGLVVIALLSIAIGAFVARWTALVVPLVLVPAYYVALYLGWWGNGVGDGWQFVAMIATTVIALGTAVTIAMVRRPGTRRLRGRLT